MGSARPIVAFLYDFDRTLCTKDMQEYSFIPNIGMEPSDFWSEADRLSTEQRMDRILAYMYLMLRKADANGQPLRRSDFVALGRDVEFFPGVLQWFSRINALGEKLGLTVEHYLISSGQREIIEGTAIAHEFREIFACEYYYNASGVAVWPLTAVNYTGKTQFLFRVNKGVLDPSDDRSLNGYVPDDRRPVPFRNMIYIGDGMTDVPCMRLVKGSGGCSVAVYTEGRRQTAAELLRDGRVNFTAPADYRPGSALDALCETILAKLSLENALHGEHLAQVENFRGYPDNKKD